MFPFRSLACLLLAAATIRAQGAAFTSTMPPGGEGPASVALGVAVPGGVSSMEVNPSLLAWEGARTNSILQMSMSQSDLYPDLHLISGMTENVQSVGLRYPVKPGTDIALGYSRHEIDFGMSEILDETGTGSNSIHSTEDVQHFVLAGRIGGIASLGVGMKWLDSRLAPGYIEGDEESGTAQALTWDVGLMVAPRWKIPGTPLRVGPSLGMSWINLGEDSVSYFSDTLKDPVDRVRRWGIAGEIAAQDLFSAQVFMDEEVDLATEGSREALEYQGWSVEVLGLYRRSSADQMDPAGWRNETQTSNEYILDLKQVWRLWWRLRQKDLMTRIEDVPDDYPLPAWTVLGTTLRPNVRITFTQSEIEDHGYRGRQGTRNGQERIGWSIAM